MAYGTVKVDNITFDNGGSDQNITVSGIYTSLTSGVTVTGTISGAVIIGSTSVSGTTVAGVTVTGTTVQGVSGTFTSLTGTTTQGTTATYTTGSFTSLTGTTTTGTTSSFTSGIFTTLSGATATFTSGIIGSGTAAAPTLSILGDPNTGIFSPGVDELGIATNGVSRIIFNSSGGVSVPGSLSVGSDAVIDASDIGVTVQAFDTDTAKTDVVQTFTAVQTLTDPAIIGTILEDVFTITDGAAFEVDPGNGSIQLITLGASRTPKATNFAAGEAVTLMVDDGSAYTLTWSDATWGGSGVVWKTNAGVAPTLNTTGYTVITFWKVATQVYGARVGDA